MSIKGIIQGRNRIRIMEVDGSREKSMEWKEAEKGEAPYLTKVFEKVSRIVNV